MIQTISDERDYFDSNIFNPGRNQIYVNKIPTSK